MTRARLVMLPCLLLIGIADLGCTGTETGNPPRATVALGLESSDARRFSVGTDGAGIEISGAQIGVQQLDFTHCNTQAVTSAARGVTVDLRGGGSSFEVPEQPLCVVELRLESRDLGWASVHPGAASQLSLGIVGQTTLAFPLFVEDAAAPRVVFRPSTLQVAAGSELLLSFDVATALSFDELEQLPRNGAGEVVVSEQQNAQVLANVRQRWASAWSLYAVHGGARELVAPGEEQ